MYPIQHCATLFQASPQASVQDHPAELPRRFSFRSRSRLYAGYPPGKKKGKTRPISASISTPRST
jgi:hypothetical protein